MAIGNLSIGAAYQPNMAGLGRFRARSSITAKRARPVTATKGVPGPTLNFFLPGFPPSLRESGGDER